MYRGNVPWSPSIQVLRDTINFWKRIIKLRLKVNISNTTIKRLAQKLQLYDVLHATLSAAQDRLSTAYATYWAAKNVVSTETVRASNYSGRARQQMDGQTVWMDIPSGLFPLGQILMPTYCAK